MALTDLGAASQFVLGGGGCVLLLWVLNEADSVAGNNIYSMWACGADIVFLVLCTAKGKHGSDRETTDS